MKEKIELYKALSDFQNEVGSFIKNTEGYGYKYTTLPEIWDTITPLLKKHGLMVYQESETSIEFIGVSTVLVHLKTGERLKSTLVMPIDDLKGMNKYQSAGSAITYARRYDLSNLLGLQSEKDTDASSGSKPKPKTPKINDKTIGLSGTKFDGGVKFLKDGGDIKTLKEKFKYVISEDVEKALLKASK